MVTIGQVLGFFSFKNTFIIFISLLALIYIGAIIVSMYVNRGKIRYWSLFCDEHGKLQKTAIAFWFILPIIVFQAINNNSITDGLVELMYGVLASEIGIIATDKIKIGKREE